jgi:signal transduction histidine kinase
MDTMAFSYGSTHEDFEYKSFVLDKDGFVKLSKEDETFLVQILGDKKGKKAVEMMKNPVELKKLLKGELIAQIPGTEAYLIHTAPGKLAFFYFGPDSLGKKYRLYQWLYILCMLILIFLIARFNRQQVKAKRVHAEVVSHLNGGLVIIDGQGIIRFHNPKMSELIGDSKLERKNFLSDYMVIESKGEYDNLIQKSGKGFDFTGKIRRVNGIEFPAIISSAEVDYPGVENARMLVIIPSEELERTIAARFIHSFSHALKTPVTSILLLADRLRRKKAVRKFDYYFSLFKMQVDEFTVMVTNLLGFSRLELENIQAQKVPGNLAILLRGVVKPFKEKALKAQLELIENIPERLMVDFDQNVFRIILNNLMENALKYTPSGKITVDAYETSKEVVIAFKNTGISVPEDEKEKIFDKFYRGKQQYVRSKDGIGIGLYLSRIYAKLHGGNLFYEPIKDEKKNKPIGSCFTIKIPK